MKNLKHDFSINEDAMVTQGTEQLPAKEVLCAFLPAALSALAAAKELIRNPFLKLVIGIVTNALEALGDSFCGTDEEG